MVRATVRVPNADNVEIALEMSMTLGEWKKLRVQLEAQPAAYPGWRLSKAIDAMVQKMDTTMREIVESDS
jgi:hypothetical protein